MDGGLEGGYNARGSGGGREEYEGRTRIAAAGSQGGERRGGDWTRIEAEKAVKRLMNRLIDR